MCLDGWILRNKLIWHRPSETEREDKTRFKRDWEYLFWFTKNKEGYYFKDVKYTTDTSVLTFPYVAPFHGVFVSGFPEELIDLAITTTCPPNGTILDPFCGTGTTGMVALDSGMNFIGIENNPKIIPELNKRLQRCKQEIQQGARAI
jgi:site-specific DNA-methyltransferase (cytosine-N4-specific)